MAKLIKRNERFGREPAYVATTLTGLEEELTRELSHLGARDIERAERALSFRASKESFYRILLWSRLSIRVFRKLGSFHASSRNALYDGVRALPWEQLFTPEETFAIRPQTASSVFKNARFASQVVKDAIVDRQRNRTERRSSVDPGAPDLQLQLRILGDRVELLLDASGEPLSRRGYRKRGGVAPINEVLAAGLLDLAGWSGERTLLDPFCGSGTILAEALIKAYRIAPNGFRHRWAHLRWPDHDDSAWRESVEEARASQGEAKSRLPGRGEAAPTVIGADISEEQLSAARENLNRLGLAERVELTQADARELDFSTVDRTKAVTVVTNVPYGERSGGEGGSDRDIEELYRGFGAWLKRSAFASDAWILTGNLPRSRSFGLRSSARIELYNGPIECRLLHFELY
ncbi:MAG: class I SAM-dependent RNA methyltransferase [Spirochaetaceae bacterium]